MLGWGRWFAAAPRDADQGFCRKHGAMVRESRPLIPAPGGPIGAGQRAPASARSALGFTHVGGTGAYTMATHEAPKHCADRVTGEPGSAIRYTEYNYRVLHHKKESHGLCLYKTVCFTCRTGKKEIRDAYQVDFCTPATPRTPGISHVRSSLPSPISTSVIIPEKTISHNSQNAYQAGKKKKKKALPNRKRCFEP